MLEIINNFKQTYKRNRSKYNEDVLETIIPPTQGKHYKRNKSAEEKYVQMIQEAKLRRENNLCQEDE